MTEQKRAKKEKVIFDRDTHGDELRRLIKDASDQKTIQEAYGEKIKEIKQAAMKNLGVSSEVWNTLFKMYHKQTRDQVEAANEEAIDLYDRMFQE